MILEETIDVIIYANCDNEDDGIVGKLLCLFSLTL